MDILHGTTSCSQTHPGTLGGGCVRQHAAILRQTFRSPEKPWFGLA